MFHHAETESIASSISDFVSSIASLSITTPPTISTAAPPSQPNPLPQPSPVLSSVLGIKPSTSTGSPAPVQSVSTSLTSALPPSSVPSSVQTSDLGGFNLSMAAPLASNASSVLSNPTMSLGGEALVTSSNPPASILSGSHLMSNSGPSQVPVSYIAMFLTRQECFGFYWIYLWLLQRIVLLGVYFVTHYNTITWKCLKILVLFIQACWEYLKYLEKLKNYEKVFVFAVCLCHLSVFVLVNISTS